MLCFGAAGQGTVKRGLQAPFQRRAEKRSLRLRVSSWPKGADTCILLSDATAGLATRGCNLFFGIFAAQSGAGTHTCCASGASSLPIHVDPAVVGRDIDLTVGDDWRAELVE